MPPRALRLAGLADVFRRVAVDYRDQLPLWGQVGDPAAANPDKPEISLGVERTAFEKPALGRVFDVGEFLDRPDVLRQGRQAPGLDRTRIGALRLGLGRASRGNDTQ